MKRGLSNGFTLVELLVVIAIIGLLATFAVTQLSGARDKARIAKGQAQAGQILRSVGDDLVGRWDFDECSGGTFADTSGYGNTGTLAAGVSFSASTPSGQGCSITLNGTTNQLTVPAPLLTAQQTKTMWVYIVGAVSGNQYILDEGLNNNTIQIYMNHVLMSENLPATGYVLSNATVVTGKWYFLVVSYDGTVMSMYIDGSLDKKWTVAGIVPTGPLSFGNYGGSGYRLNGSLDDLRLYNRSLTSQEIHRMYAEGLPRHVATR